MNTDNNANEESVELTRRELLTHYAITGDYKLTEDEVVESLESFLTSGPSSEGLVSKSGEKKYSLKKADTIIYKFNKPSVATNNLYSKGESDEESDDVNLFVYDINKEDGNGYAILCDDLRIGDVICIADGEYRFGDSDNPIAQYFEEQLDSYINDTKQVWEDLNENDVELLKNKCGITDEDIQETIQQNIFSKASEPIRLYDWKIDQINEKCILKTKWGQRSFYNDAIQAVKGKDYYVGCTAVATAQLIAFHKRPYIMSSPNGRTRFFRLKALWPKVARNWGGVFDWDVIYDPGKVKAENPSNKKTVERLDSRFYQIPALMYEVAEGIKSVYTEKDGTSAYLGDSVNYLRSIGYKCDNTTRNDKYSFDDIKKSIDRGLPVLARGSSHKGGHAWVMDGYKKCHRDQKLYVRSSGSCKTVTTRIYGDFVHCNFGWEGDSDGYYIDRVFGEYNKNIKIATNARY